MSNIEELIFNEIISIIKDNLKILINNKDDCLYRFKHYCDTHDVDNIPIDYYDLIYFTEEALYALLNANFLYDFRDIE